jgi:hypothetical protein
VPPPRLAIRLLLLAAGLLTAAGVAALVIGLFFGAWLYSLLPPILIDEQAVGGAATAIGVVLLLTGLLHAGAAVGLARGAEMLLTPAIVLCSAMSLLAIGWGVAALVSAASGSGVPAAMLPAAVGLGVVAVAYAWIARRLIGLRRPPEAGS